MASLGEVTVLVTSDVAAEVEKIKKELVAVDEARIRAIVREELEAWEKRQIQRIPLARGF
jgi:hypothetical protein